METPLPMQDTPEETWRIACHEAGHAVVGVRHKIPIEFIEIGEGENGEVSFSFSPIDRPTGKPSLTEISQWQQAYAAGAAAEQLLFGHYREYGSCHDRNLHNEWEKLRHQMRREGWDRDIHSAIKILDRESVEKVARALVRAEKLSGEDVHKLLGCILPWEQ